MAYIVWSSAGWGGYCSLEDAVEEAERSARTTGRPCMVSAFRDTGKAPLIAIAYKGGLAWSRGEARGFE